MKLVSQIIKDERGQDMIEYALIAGFIAVAAGAAVPGVATSVSNLFGRIATVLNAQNPGGGS